MCVLCVSSSFQASPGPSDYGKDMQSNERQAFSPQPDIFLIMVVCLRSRTPGHSSRIDVCLSLYRGPGVGEEEEEDEEGSDRGKGLIV